MKIISKEQIEYGPLKSLEIELPDEKPELGKEVYEKRLEIIRKRMKEEGLEILVVYGDREHYSNFRYFAGFEPRFEEGLLIIHLEDPNYVLLGNECLGLHKESKISVRPILCQALSLPNQTMDQFVSMEECFEKAGIRRGSKVGAVGWKLFDSSLSREYRYRFCIPEYLITALRQVTDKEGTLINATELLIHPGNGIRIVNDVHTIAQMEYGAAYASGRMKEMLDALEPGRKEMELASFLDAGGQVRSCHDMLASGVNVSRGLISPTDRKIIIGDAFVSSMGLEGGLSCRGGYAVHFAEELDESCRNYLDDLAIPYYAAVATWYENIGIGISGGEMYDTIQAVLPKETYGWVLNPGHLIGTEEWLSSPIYPGSLETFRSGMTVQMDIIPGMPPYSSPNAEDGVCLADEGLQKELKEIYPKVYDRMQRRRNYMEEELGIKLRPEVLPMSNLAGEYRPFLLNSDYGLSVNNR